MITKAMEKAAPVSLAEIEGASRNYSVAYDVVADRLRALDEEMAAIKRKHMGGIKRAVATAAEKKSELANLIMGAPGLFVKPRTYIFNGIKVGMIKGKGAIELQDEAKTVELIKKHLPDQAEVLIKTKESLVKKAIEQLSASDLKRIGAHVVDAIDRVVIETTAGDVEKAIEALLKDAVAMETEEVKVAA